MSADLSAIPPQSQTWPGTVAELTLHPTTASRVGPVATACPASGS